MWDLQKGKCAICDKEETTKSQNGTIKALSVDHHDHETGEIRGLLCNQCNQGIGCLKDDPVVVQKAANYLIKHKLNKKNS